MFLQVEPSAVHELTINNEIAIISPWSSRENRVIVTVLLACIDHMQLSISQGQNAYQYSLFYKLYKEETNAMYHFPIGYRLQQLFGFPTTSYISSQT